MFLFMFLFLNRRNDVRNMLVRLKPSLWIFKKTPVNILTANFLKSGVKETSCRPMLNIIQEMDCVNYNVTKSQYKFWLTLWVILFILEVYLSLESRQIWQQKRNAFPHLKWKLQCIYWDSNTLLLCFLQKGNMQGLRDVLFFVYDFRESVASRSLGKIPYLNPPCVPNMGEVYFDCQNSKLMSAWIFGNNLIIAAENVANDPCRQVLLHKMLLNIYINIFIAS